MADQMTVKDAGGGRYENHPEGQYVGICVDVVNLGDRVEQFGDFPEKIVPKCALVFQTGEVNSAGEPHILVNEFTVSMGDRANLRKFLEHWRGRSYSPVQIEQGVPLHKLEGQAGLLAVEHRESRAGKTYAKIGNIMPVPKGAVLPTLPEYTRPEYLEKRKTEYKEGVAKWHAEHGKRATNAEDDFSDFPPPDDDPNPLPF